MGQLDLHENPDGTLTFDDYGIGAVFIPSGLGYYNTPPLGSPIEYLCSINIYIPLVFNRKV